MARNINVKVKENLTLKDGKVKKIFQTEAKKCGNGAIIYVPKKHLKDKFYVIVVDNHSRKPEELRKEVVSTR